MKYKHWMEMVQNVITRCIRYSATVITEEGRSETETFNRKIAIVRLHFQVESRPNC